MLKRENASRVSYLSVECVDELLFAVRGIVLRDTA